MILACIVQGFLFTGNLVKETDTTYVISSVIGFYEVPKEDCILRKVK